jgi:hypothetical protein
MKMSEDEITQVRRIRHEISAKFDHNVHELVAYYQALERELKNDKSYTFEEAPELSTSQGRSKDAS